MMTKRTLGADVAGVDDCPEHPVITQHPVIEQAMTTVTSNNRDLMVGGSVDPSAETVCAVADPFEPGVISPQMRV